MPILDKYIFGEWLKIFLMVLGAMVGMLSISAIYNNLKDLMEWGVPALPTIEFFLMTAVGFLPVIIPVSMLVSLLFILGHFHKSQELSAWRAAGLSIFRITRSLWIAGFGMSVLMLVLNATLVPYATECTAEIAAHYELLYRQAHGENVKTSTQGKFLFYNNIVKNRLWMIGNFSQYTGTGFNVNIFEYDKNGRALTREIIAERGDYDDFARVWTLKNGREIIYEDGVAVPVKQPAFKEKKFYHFDENPRIMALVNEDVDDLTIPEINEIVRGVKDNSENSKQLSSYAVRYHSILASPFCCLIVVGIAIPFAVAGVRTNPMVGVSKSIGLFALYFVFTNIFNMLGAKMFLPAVIAAWAPNLILLVYAIWLCRKIN